MEQSMLVDSGRETDPQNDQLLSTPCRVQKRLFVPCSSSKRSLFREEREPRREPDGLMASDAESDLGPMSPLALTDLSSCDSSPGRQFVSPLATPEKSPVIPLTNWSRIMSSAYRRSGSPRRHFGTPPSARAASRLASSARRSRSMPGDEVLPETPGKDSDLDDQHSYVEETPQKEYSESRLITPMGSLCKNISIPKVHRRKSSGTVDVDESMSPEIKKCTFKRHLEDSLSFPSAKHQKNDELASSIPKARAALFKDENKNTTEKTKGFMLTPKSFYGSSIEKSRKSETLTWREPQRDLKKRKSLPSYGSTHRRSSKKHRGGEINLGVWHGIKKPKPKRQSLQNIPVKSEKQNDKAKNKSKEAKENLNPQNKTTMDNIRIQKINNDNQEVVEEIDPNKKFFKTRSEHNAVVTVNDKIKLRIALNQKDAKHIDKKAKLDKMSFDTADLSVDEPNIQKSLEQSKVNNILKILEDDWADDECEAMEAMQTCCSKTLSPRKFPEKYMMLKSLTMSPGSELSSMTSSMNIEDIPSSLGSQVNKNLNNVNASTEIPTQKFYPLFSKNYSPKIPNDECNAKKRKRSSASWQLSTKYGNAENQYQLDAGQKMFGATQCNECGIVYHIGDPDDENAHLNYHNSFKILKFQGWKNERIVYEDSYTSSRIIIIDPKDSNLYWKKVNDILEIVDRDLGLSDMKLSCYRDKRIYMYVKDKTILGILVAEYVKSAFNMIPELSDLNCCTSESTPVKCGINVVWTAMSHRRQGIATKLVDILRTTYYYGCVLTIEDIAFSTPTPSGKLFAEKYTQTPNFKVY